MRRIENYWGLPEELKKDEWISLGQFPYESKYLDFFEAISEGKVRGPARPWLHAPDRDRRGPSGLKRVFERAKEVAANFLFEEAPRFPWGIPLRRKPLPVINHLPISPRLPWPMVRMTIEGSRAKKEGEGFSSRELKVLERNLAQALEEGSCEILLRDLGLDENDRPRGVEVLVRPGRAREVKEVLLLLDKLYR